MDIASSSLGEKHAVYGGAPNLKLGLKNVMTKYDARMIGISTTCLTETIGDDVPMIVREFISDLGNGHKDTDIPALITVSTPSYSGTHIEGFHAAVRAVIDRLSTDVDTHEGLNIFPGFVSPADVRYLKEVLDDFHLKGTVLPDISRTLDGEALTQYENVPSGGTPISQIQSMGGSRASLEFSRTLDEQSSPAALLEEKFRVPRHILGMPIGLRESDEFFGILCEASGRELPEEHCLERGRLIDSYVDGHKYVFGKRAIVYGEADLVVGLTAFLAEIGIQPVLCATGSVSGKLEDAIRSVAGELLSELPTIMEGADFFSIEESAAGLMPDLLIGNSKGNHLARKLGVPLVRVGFPIHDRFGGQRLLHVGYRGAQSLFDRVVNTLIASKQDRSSVGYTYM
jgi:nitrogenase molybdenum-iron protein NifN